MCYSIIQLKLMSKSNLLYSTVPFENCKGLSFGDKFLLSVLSCYLSSNNAF